MPGADYDYIIIGSGIAGLNTALLAREHGSTLILTKGQVDDCNTRYAQGGIAAAIGAGDTPALHMQDTLAAGAGLCDREAVDVLTSEGPQRVANLIQWGVPFDTMHGEISLGMEGAHSRPRILHAGGDATGQHIEVALANRVAESEIRVLEYTLATNLVVEGGRTVAVEALDCRTGQRETYSGRNIVIGTGGAGQLFKYTTNPEVATGDGVALAFRAGARVMDMEFYQFHPTALRLKGAPTFLLSEAMRGEGAVLRNSEGRAFMADYHPLADLAPRDVVSRAIAAEMDKTDGAPVYLDISHLPSRLGTKPVSHYLPLLPKLWTGHNERPCPGGSRRPLHDGGHQDRYLGSHQRPRPLRMRGGRLLRRPRRQPAGQQLPAGHPGIRAAAGQQQPGPGANALSHYWKMRLRWSGACRNGRRCAPPCPPRAWKTCRT